jgi:hypothetical protein
MILTFVNVIAMILVVLYALALACTSVLNRSSLYRFKMSTWIAFGGPLAIVWLLVGAFS